MKEAFIAFVLFLSVILLVFFIGKQYWAKSSNSSFEHVEGESSSLKCITHKEVTNGVGNHIFTYLSLKAYEKDTGIKTCNPPYIKFEQLEKKSNDADQIRKSLGMNKEGEDCANCRVFPKGDFFAENYQEDDEGRNDRGKSRLFRHRAFLQNLYKPPTDFPKLLDKNKFNLVVHYRVLNLQDAKDHPDRKDHQDRKQITVETVQKVINHVIQDGIDKNNIVIHVMTQKSAQPGEEAQKKAFLNQNWKLHEDVSEADTFDAMVRADALLITTNSNFSKVGGLLNKSKYVFQAVAIVKDLPNSEASESWFPVL